jgi:hypothetical protein
MHVDRHHFDANPDPDLGRHQNENSDPQHRFKPMIDRPTTPQFFLTNAATLSVT